MFSIILPSSASVAGFVMSVCLLTGCASGASPIAESFRLLGSRNFAIDAAKLSSDHKYLRVTVSGRTALLVLGYMTPHPDGPLETWYSAQGEVIKLQNGRIVGTAGLATDWREVRYTGLPGWQAAGISAITYFRERDEMPGYRFGIRNGMLLKPIAPPEDSSLLGSEARRFIWFAESALPDNVGATLPPSRYAVESVGDKAQVIYAEQCLSEDLCLSWQRWPSGK